ncbi:MAG TPA: amylo-alpha-1,6-glucosidase [Candidatus Baltobacteraceae bacterium]|nr:amylo-alpha-1,6-glucosidase [Candidatus Baltobacteraceae bacterium]
MRFGCALCGDFEAAERREWLLTNGRGGYAMGTVGGTLTRRYHGLLVAAIDPPVTRRLVVAKLELDAEYDGASFALSTNRWASGAVAPDGWTRLEAFAYDDGLPVWTYALGDALLEVALAMPHGVDAVALGLRVVRARAPIALRGRLIVADRDHHGGPLPDPAGFVTAVAGDAATIALPACGRTLHVFGGEDCGIEPAREVYRGFSFPRERERGLPDADDYLHALTLAWRLDARAGAGVVLSLDPGVPRDPHAIVDARRAAHRALAAAQPSALLGELAIAADAFVVARGEAPGAGTTIVAGYPWFTDWGRDAMIALPGLLLDTGRAREARAVLLTFASHERDGLMPNRFPDAGGPAEYNTIDASLWFVETARAYVAATGDLETLRALRPAIASIVAAYRDGTRFGIGSDADGLVRGGAEGLQLTWMDAKVGDRVVTPRRGKPVEINALWYNALRACERFAHDLGEDAAPYAALAERVASSMQRFWDPARGCCYDVLDGPDGDDASVRPNQLFAVALPASAFDDAQARAIVDVCAARLWTSVGPRSLDPSDPRYRGAYGGDQAARDAAYHQGTVWPWLAGAFVRAHLRAYRDPALTRTFLQPLVDALETDCVSTLFEVAGGDAPHAPGGCPAQAWSVAELIGAIRLLDAHGRR